MFRRSGINARRSRTVGGVAPTYEVPSSRAQRGIPVAVETVPSPHSGRQGRGKSRPRHRVSPGPPLSVAAVASPRADRAGCRLRPARARTGRVRGAPPDRKSVVEGKSVSVRVDLGGPRIIQKKNKIKLI